MRSLTTLLCGIVLVATPIAASAQPSRHAVVPPPGATERADTLVTVTLRDGQLLRGYILAETSQYIVLRLVSGGEMPVAHADIRDLKRNDETVFVSETAEIYKHDPNRTRYLYGPSAFMLRQGEGYFSQTELVASTLGYGVTDWLTIQVGTVAPALLAGEGNVIAGARIGTSLSEHFHIAAGVHTLAVPEAVIGIALGTVTLGTPRAHVSVSAGYPFALDGDDNEIGPAIASLSGNVRVSKHFALVSENWIFVDDDDSYVLGSIAGRFMGEHSAVDVGLVLLEDVDVPVPWLDFTWNWD